MNNDIANLAILTIILEEGQCDEHIPKMGKLYKVLTKNLKGSVITHEETLLDLFKEYNIED